MRKTTFEDAIAAADELFSEGIKPSVIKIREKLNGKGGQQAIQDALNEWWGRLHQKVDRYERREGVPDSLFKIVGQLWVEAVNKAETSFQEQRATLSEERAVLESECEQVQNEHQKTKGRLTDSIETNEKLIKEQSELTDRITQLIYKQEQTNQLHKDEIASWGNKSQELQSKYKVSTEQINRLNKEVVTAKERLQQNSEEHVSIVAELNGKVSTLFESCDKAKNEIISLSNTKKDTQVCLDKSLIANEQLTISLSKFTKEKKALEVSCEELKKEATKYKYDALTLKSRIEVSANKAKADDALLAEKRSEITNLKADLSNLNKALNNSKIEIGVMQATLRKQSSDILAKKTGAKK